MQLVTRPDDAESVNHSLAILPHCLIMLIQRYGSPDITLQVTSYIICFVNKTMLIAHGALSCLYLLFFTQNRRWC